MNKEEFLSKVWRYYIMLEMNFKDTFNYVEPEEENNNSFSKEYEKLFLSICSEIDIVCKELCKIIENKSSDDVNKYNIVNYRDIISNDGNFLNESCIFSINGEVLQPWSEWQSIDSPFWWKNYNKLKHDRLNTNNYKLGNYLNVKTSLSALFILIRILYRKMFSLEPFPQSSLFQMKNWVVYNNIGNGFYNVLDNNGGMGITYFGD